MEKQKFTIEQYQEIVQVQEKEFTNYVSSYGKSGDTLYGTLGLALATFVRKNDLFNELMALANPITRDLVKERFVEQENQYYWRRKKNNEDDGSVYLDIDDYGVIIPKSVYSYRNYCYTFTESEIVEAGYNPDMYEKLEL